MAHRLITPEAELPPLEVISEKSPTGLIRGTSRRHKATLALFALTLFTSSSLLFLVQPMFAKMVLPLLGGTPAVWNTSMVFFQAALLLGYAYSHFGVNRLGLRRQAIVHIAVVIAPMLLLPIAIPESWTPPSDSTPVLWLLALLAVSLGLPFFAVSTTAPLLQKWFAGTGHPAGKDPYFLYGASNLGSMLALLGYPILMEPRFALATQSRLWTLGYVVLAAGVTSCAAVVLRGKRASLGDAAAPVEIEVGETRPVNWPRRLKWIALAFVPSSFMLGVTTHLSTDIAAIPLLWVIPLALYLLTFILVFSPRPVSGRWPARIQPAIVIMLVLFMLTEGFADLPKAVLIGLPLLAFFLTTLVCHAQLAADRPSTRHLTEFYLWMAVGGVLGGIFNALIAPVVFDKVYEYPIAVVLGCMLAPRLGRSSIARTAKAKIVRVIVPVAVIATVVALITVKNFAFVGMSGVGLIAALLLCGLLAHRPLSFGAAIAAVIIAATAALGDQAPVLFQGRTFFGVYRVVDDGSFHRLRHGTTLHGLQSDDPARKMEPLSYYHTRGPIAQVLTELPAADSPRIGVVGLGAGSLACYGNADQDWVFWEIDPIVEQIARDPALFTFLRDCPGKHEVVLGDARLTMAGAPDGSFGVLVLDAFSSDAIPVHLLTREAFQLYLKKLTPDGVLAVHISNRYLDLEPVLANLAKDAGVTALIRKDGNTDQPESARRGSDWVALARDPASLEPLRTDPRWATPVAEKGSRVWTDDFSDVFSVFRWR